MTGKERCKPEFDKEDTNFAIWFYEGILSRDPDNVEVLFILGNLYTRAGLYEKGLECDKKLCRLRSDDPIFRYNLACSYSLLGEVDLAFEAMLRAIELGYNDCEFMEQDPDLQNLRSDPRFRLLLGKLKG